jgi:hypothetical protein
VEDCNREQTSWAESSAECRVLVVTHCTKNVATAWCCSNSEDRFTLEVKANVQLKSSIPIGAKLEIAPKGFTLGGIKAEIENIFSICPKLLINAEP